MVKYTGYGNAAGFLVRLGLHMGGNANGAEYSDDDENSDSEEFLAKRHR